MLRNAAIIILFLFRLFYAGAQNDTVALHYSKQVIAKDLYRDLSVIASDEYEGRETGKDGQKKAAAYISNEFRKAGIPPLFKLSYYQQFPIMIQFPNEVAIEINNKKYESRKDFYCFPGMEQEKINASEIVFLGYGISDKKYDDYKGKQVKGKVLMILDGEPLDKDSISLVTGKKEVSEWTGYYKRKREMAESTNATALLIVVKDLLKNMLTNANHIDARMMKLIDEKEPQYNMPVFYISTEMATEILRDKKQSAEQLGASIVKKKAPVSFNVWTKLFINIEEKTEEGMSENVLGYLEGGDLKDQLVVVSAHYDHLGKNGNIVFNGADDDGSGTVAVLELARAFAKAKAEGRGPRRSILFMTFAGEEKGLLGSKYYSQNPLFPLKNTVADLNIDMIGRTDEKHSNQHDYIYIIGSDKLSSQLHNINESVNKTYTHLELDYTYNDPADRNRFYYRSDHYNFAKNNVPVIFYFNGTHADYHKESDEVSKIDFDLIEKRARLVFFTAWELANRATRITVDVPSSK